MSALRPPQPFEELAGQIDRARQLRGDAIKTAMARRDAAQAAVTRAAAAKEQAKQESELADKTLRTLLDVGEMVVIGDQLITLTASGGVVVQPVKLLGLV